MFAMAEAVEGVSGALASGSGSTGGVPGVESTPAWMTKAIWTIEQDEPDLDDRATLQAISLFQWDPKLTVTYLAFGKKNLHWMWFQQQLDMENASIEEFQSSFV